MNNRIYIHDEDFITGIKNDDDRALSTLYKLHFPMIQHFIIQNNGDVQDAKDVYQEGIITLYNNIKNNTFKQESQIKTYLYSICRRLWMTELKRKNKFADNLTDHAEYITFDHEIEERIFDGNNKFKLIDSSLKKLGEPCQAILKYFYVERLSMQEIALKMNYTNMDNAKTQKYKCLQRLKKIYFTFSNKN